MSVRLANLVLCGVFFAETIGTCVSSRERRGVAVVAAPPPVASVSVAPEPLPRPPPPWKPAGPELPRGGRDLFPQYRLVGYCGTPGGPKLGRLLGDLRAPTKAIDDLAKSYAKDREPLDVFELIVVVATNGPGVDHKYRRRVPDAVVDHYLEAARKAKALLLLNIQPGASDFMTEVKAYEKYLHEPEVGLALDPEWAMTNDKETPGTRFGMVTGATLNEVAEHLSDIVHQDDLPEKAMVFHQVNQWVLKNEADIEAHRDVVIIKSVDGLGPRGSKIKTYDALLKGMPAAVHPGFKLFYDEDTRTVTGLGVARRRHGAHAGARVRDVRIAQRRRVGDEAVVDVVVDVDVDVDADVDGDGDGDVNEKKKKKKKKKKHRRRSRRRQRPRQRQRQRRRVLGGRPAASASSSGNAPPSRNGSGGHRGPHHKHREMALMTSDGTIRDTEAAVLPTRRRRIP